MNKNKFFLKSVIATGVMALSIGTAFAQNMYGGASYALVNLDAGSGVSDPKPTVVYGTLGYAINKNFAVEGRLGGGVSDDTITYLGVPDKVKIKNYYGAYLKGIVPLNDTFSVYALAGGSGAKVSASAGGGSISDSQTSGSYGFGASVGTSGNVALTLEWARLFKDADAFTFGVSFKF